MADKAIPMPVQTKPRPIGLLGGVGFLLLVLTIVLLTVAFFSTQWLTSKRDGIFTVANTVGLWKMCRRHPDGGLFCADSADMSVIAQEWTCSVATWPDTPECSLGTNPVQNCFRAARAMMILSFIFLCLGGIVLPIFVLAHVTHAVIGVLVSVAVPILFLLSGFFSILGWGLVLVTSRLKPQAYDFNWAFTMTIFSSVLSIIGGCFLIGELLRRLRLANKYQDISKRDHLILEPNSDF